MKVKKFCGLDNHEAMQKVRADLGPNAVILHQRKIKQKGFLGLFKKPVIEIVAAVEEVEKPRVPLTVNQFHKPEEILKARVHKSVVNSSEDHKLSRDINEIKSMLSNVIKKVDIEGGDDLLKDLNNDDLINLYNHLKEHEIDEELIKSLIQDIKEINSDDEKLNFSIEEAFKKIIDKYIAKGQSIHSKIVFFVGPTGVGKTTTIAKLAANYTLNFGKKVSFISADTYRIAAVEQLKTYSDILNIPIEVIYETQEIHRAIDKLKHNDIIMIDTAGRSHRNNQQINELSQLLDEVQEKEIYLVISCTSNNKDVKDIVDTYSFIEDYRIIFTKIDETNTYGTILNTAYKTNRPISYITTGQCVPDDIEVVNVDRLISLLMKEA
ncbi:flagellar biosynthesis protein FlhF [Alkaliphilus serpentinus]|uniref:Flagellar biosynthesis protein FlhF n=1 Tax=Alkaliphilus serpentinus TaxID=1482731 RepID=A0A833M8L8_9FIRM|nr:flagellar biosynthesis protein FlhF [Alkaliphilus serpentinus]KAB3531366.1 flagellar biosynthesis protein FlhF [Alkaliphilus serpentinus]